MKSHHPESVFRARTKICNNEPRCRYCRNSGESETGKPLTLEQEYGIIDQMKRMGASNLIYTGGEPFLYPDLAGLVNYACERGIKVTIATNGKLLTGEFLSGMEKDRLKIQVSLDSIYKEVNDKLRGEGSYDAAIKALDLCKEYGIKSQTSVTITKVNLNSIPDTIENAKSNGSLVKLRQMVPIGRGESLRELMVNDTELNDLIMKYVINPEYEGFVDIEQVPYFYKDKPEAAKVCSAGSSILYIEPDGNVKICPSSNHSVGNVIDKPLKEIYEDMNRFRGEGHKDSGFCGRQNVLSVRDGGKTKQHSPVPESYTAISREPMSTEIFNLFGCKCTG